MAATGLQNEFEILTGLYQGVHDLNCARGIHIPVLSSKHQQQFAFQSVGLIDV